MMTTIIMMTELWPSNGSRSIMQIHIIIMNFFIILATKNGFFFFLFSSFLSNKQKKFLYISAKTKKKKITIKFKKTKKKKKSNYRSRNSNYWSRNITHTHTHSQKTCTTQNSQITYHAFEKHSNSNVFFYLSKILFWHQKCLQAKLDFVTTSKNDFTKKNQCKK